MNPRHPVYIVSKGRWDTRLTSKALERMKVPYHIVVEHDEYDNYASVIDPKKILILPQKYLDEYDTCDELGYSIGKGSGAARNFCWEHSNSLGSEWHWVIDDNIENFHRLNRNVKPIVGSGTIFKCAEDFVDRYENIALAGFNYYSFCKTTERVAPFYVNTRIYSCMMINNSIPYRWRCRYNEDTDLSLRVLKDGYNTILFNAFLAGKVTTLRMKGGNTESIYKNGEYVLNKSKMLERMHPDIAKVTWKFNRWHHTVDYKNFKSRKLVRKAGVEVPDVINNYGMKMIEL